MNIKHSTSAFRQYKAEKIFQSNWKMIQIHKAWFIYTDIMLPLFDLKQGYLLLEFVVALHFSVLNVKQLEGEMGTEAVTDHKKML